LPEYTISPTPLFEGEKSVVFAASRNGKKYAIKSARISPHSLNEENFIKKLPQHESVTRLIHSVKTDDYSFFVLDFHPDNLEEYLMRTTRPSENTAKKIIKQCLAALKHIHENGILHGDFEPDNILLSKSGNVKVSDFGYALNVNARGIKESLVAEPYPPGQNLRLSTPYLSPDYGHLEDSVKRDIWSMGVITHQLLTSSTNTAAIPAHTIPAQARDIIKSMLAPIPEDRPSPATLIQHEWLSPSTIS
jgi:serine/threonine protein kinase